jgi:hypothetical protein
MSYTIYFTDLAKTNDALIIDDNTIDSRLSVSFVGKNASNYASAVSTNFLHLLENFANTEPPTGLSVQGQLWYDTSNPDIPVLRIGNPSAGNGSPTSWAPASGVWAQSTTPGGNSTYGGAKAGDIWVNTAQGQLYINTDGTNNWTLVGPSFSGTLQTGSFPDTINDNFGVPHKIIKNFIDGNIVEIISNDTFIPQSKIAGFTNILPGINVSTLNNAALNATAYAAKNLYVTSPSNAYVPTNNFVRNDIDNKITAALTVKDGILLGTNPTFTLKVNPLLARESQIINSVDGGIITFTIYNSAVANKLLRIDGVTQSLGIGIPDRPPAVTSGGVEVGGDTLIGGKITVSSTGSTFNGSLSASTIISTGTITSGDDLTVGGQLYVNWNNGGSVGPAILPGTSGSPVTDTFDIGSPSAKFRFVYADSFQGNLGGTAQTANSLTNASAFAIQGDIQSTADVTYKGQLGTYVFATTITTAAITGKPVSSKVVAKDWTNFYNMPSNGAFNIIGVETTGTATISSNIVQIEKQNFLADIYANLVPTGAILPYAGLVAPDGWLLCDGQGAYKSQYPALFNAIGYTYGQPVPSDTNIFGLPDLRGRGVVGYDDMDNGTFGLPNAGRVSSAVKPDGSIGSAATVAGGTSTVFLSTGTISTGTGVETIVDNSISINVMNPYLAMNYIIKT